MGVGVRLRRDLSAGGGLAKRSEHAGQARQSLFAGGGRLTGRAVRPPPKLGAMGRRTRDRAHRYNEKGLEGLDQRQGSRPTPETVV
jgi:hypothetical protein